VQIPANVAELALRLVRTSSNKRPGARFSTRGKDRGRMLVTSEGIAYRQRAPWRWWQAGGDRRRRLRDHGGARTDQSVQWSSAPNRNATTRIATPVRRRSPGGVPASGRRARERPPDQATPSAALRVR